MGEHMLCSFQAIVRSSFVQTRSIVDLKLEAGFLLRSGDNDCHTVRDHERFCLIGSVLN